jgi:hypothetical protein
METIRFQCPSCRKPVRVDKQFAGAKGRCPSCDQVVEIPHADQALPDEPEAPASSANDATEEFDNTEISRLAAAIIGQESPRRPAGRVPPPPPPPTAAPPDEIDLDAVMQTHGDEEAEETDILPAEYEGPEGRADSKGDSAPKRSAETSRRGPDNPAESRQRAPATQSSPRTPGAARRSRKTSKGPGTIVLMLVVLAVLAVAALALVVLLT